MEVNSYWCVPIVGGDRSIPLLRRYTCLWLADVCICITGKRLDLINEINQSVSSFGFWRRCNHFQDYLSTYTYYVK